jgi:hypothetical protein
MSRGRVRSWPRTRRQGQRGRSSLSDLVCSVGGDRLVKNGWTRSWGMVVRQLVGLVVGTLTVLLMAFVVPSFAQAESVEVSHGANPTQDVALTISASGMADGKHKLYVYVKEGAYTCEARPGWNSGGTYLANGEALSAGAFSKEYSYTPTSVGTYTICAYLDATSYEPADAKSVGTFSAALPSGTVSVGVIGNPTQDVALTVKVAGTTQIPRSLYVYVKEGAYTCEARPGWNSGGTYLANGEALSAGAFSKEYSYTPNQTNTYTICSYVDDSTYGTADATASGTFTNITPQTRAEEEKRAKERAAVEAERAAEQAAGEAAQAAEARKLAEYLHGVAERGHCEELSSAPSSVAACKADEAAIRAAEEARAAQERAEWSALKAIDLAKPVKSLSIQAVVHQGTSSQHPGNTILRITTSPFAHVTIQVRHYGHRTERVDAWPRSLTSRTGTLEIEYSWTCSRPGGIYAYVVFAKTGVGRTLARKGHFNPVSATRCDALKRYEQEARERSARRYAEGVRQEREAENARQREGENNCRNRGGTPIILYIEGQPYNSCRLAAGGTIPWIP